MCTHGFEFLPLTGTEKYGLSGSPAAWRGWRTEECVNPQAAGIYAVAVELMVLLAPSGSRRLPDTVAMFIEYLRDW